MNKRASACKHRTTFMTNEHLIWFLARIRSLLLVFLLLISSTRPSTILTTTWTSLPPCCRVRHFVSRDITFPILVVSCPPQIRSVILVISLGLEITVNLLTPFKARRDKFWCNQDIVYDFRAQLQGTGSPSEVLYE